MKSNRGGRLTLLFLSLSLLWIQHPYGYGDVRSSCDSDLDIADRMSLLGEESVGAKDFRGGLGARRGRTPRYSDGRSGCCELC